MIDQENAGCEVLLAEDDEEMQRLVRHALERRGYRVHATRDGLEALEYLRNCQTANGPRRVPDLIITDGYMPRCTGYSFLAALTRMRLAIPAVFMTAFGDPEADGLATRLGARAVLHKPCDMDMLGELVGQLASSGGARTRRRPATPARVGTESSGLESS